ncbi:MAG: PAS domain S-box protein [Syntrophaceae bacterium]|nr:PAS domain S-box protein [Syntrophaceae bacterium]
MRVLLIEDVPIDAELCMHEIEKAVSSCEFLVVDTREGYLAALEDFQPDFIVSDFRLPSFDGLSALNIALEKTPDTPFIILTGSMNEDTAVECMKAGAWDYVIKEHVKRLGTAFIAALEQKRLRQERRESDEKYRTIFEHAEEGIYQSSPEGRFILVNQAMARILGYDSTEELMSGVTDIGRQLYVHPKERTDLIEKALKRDDLSIKYETQLYRKDGRMIWVSRTIRAVRDKKGEIKYYEGMMNDITEKKESVIRLRNTLVKTIHTLAAVVETRDPYTAGHQERVAEIARAIAEEMGLDDEMIEGIYMAGIIHDIGKIAVPIEILTKPTKLTMLEFSLIKEHPHVGHEMVKDIESPWPLMEIIYQHHERINGSGYPRNLKGDEMLVEARIIAVADVVEAMASYRPYRPALGIDAALDEIEKNRGILYDADVVDTCLKLFREKGYQLKPGM